MISSFWRHLAIIVKEDVSFFVQHYHHHTSWKCIHVFKPITWMQKCPKNLGFASSTCATVANLFRSILKVKKICIKDAQQHWKKAWDSLSESAIFDLGVLHLFWRACKTTVERVELYFIVNSVRKCSEKKDFWHSVLGWQLIAMGKRNLQGHILTWPKLLLCNSKFIVF